MNSRQRGSRRIQKVALGNEEGVGPGHLKGKGRSIKKNSDGLGRGKPPSNPEGKGGNDKTPGSLRKKAV